MSTASEHGRDLSNLYVQLGEVRGREAANKAAIWGGALANIGDFVAQYPERKAKMEEIKNRAAMTDLEKQRLQRQIDQEARQQAEDDQFRELFKRSQTEFDAGQGDSPQSSPDLTRGPDDSGQMQPGGLVQEGRPSLAGEIGATLASGRGPLPIQQRTSPLPTPSELMRVNPERAIKIINGLAALKQDPQDDPEKEAAALRQVALGLNALPEDMRAAAYPGIVQHYPPAKRLVDKGRLSPTYEGPDYWKFIMGTGQEPPKPTAPKTAQIATIGADGKPVTKFVEETPGAEYPQVPKESEITPYQKEELIRRDKEIALSQQRLALAVKQANKPAIAKEATGLADAVIANPVLWGQLTPTAKQAIAPELQQRGFTAFNKPPSATVENRLASAQAVTQTGNDIISQLSDPKVRGMLGPAMGRYNSVREFIGNPPPELSDLAASIESFALANMGVHGMRSVQGADEIKQLLDRKHTPDSLIKTIQGLNRFSQHFLQNEDPKRLSTPAVAPSAPSGGAPGLSYQDYLKSKGGK